MSKGEDAVPGERIAKRIARAGVCSRREAEAMIAQGRVSVDGRVIASPALNVTGAHVIRVDGAALSAPAPARIFRYHKPAGLIVTRSDPQGRPTIFDRLPANLPRLITVGRLDLSSEGLLLLTNDGALARTLELPATGWIRRYRARAFGAATESDLATLKRGVTVGGVRYGPIEAAIESRKGGNVWLIVSLKEGKNREVRRALETLGLQVNRLIRTGYGPFQLGGLERGGVAEVPAKQMREQLGGRLSAPS